MKDNNHDLTIDIHRLAKSLGADLVGIADASVFNTAPEGMRAWDFLPSVTSVVVMGRRMPVTTILKGDKKRQSLLAAASYITLNNMITELARFLEDRECEALPIYHAYFVTGRPPAGTRIETRFDLSYKHSAVAAGLGELGLHSLLITPEYGPLLRLTALLTDAPLKTNTAFDQTLCRKHEGCVACLKACPSGAITEQGINKQTCFEYLQQDYERYYYGTCVRCMAACAKVLGAFRTPITIDPQKQKV
jgi:epoxyqueuosine reductase